LKTEFPVSFNGQPPPPRILPCLELLYAWQADIRVSAWKRLWRFIKAKMMKAAKEGERRSLRSTSGGTDEVTKLHAAALYAGRDSLLVDVMTSYLPPSRGIGIRTLQV
jgi:hypothetical protein